MWDFFKKIGEKVFEELFRQKIDEFEKRIHSLEKEVAVLRKTVEDNSKDIEDLNLEIKEAYKSSAKMEGALQALFYVLKNEDIKRLKDGDS